MKRPHKPDTTDLENTPTLLDVCVVLMALTLAAFGLTLLLCEIYHNTH